MNSSTKGAAIHTAKSIVTIEIVLPANVVAFSIAASSFTLRNSPAYFDRAHKHKVINRIFIDIRALILPRFKKSIFFDFSSPGVTIIKRGIKKTADKETEIKGRRSEYFRENSEDKHLIITSDNIEGAI